MDRNAEIPIRNRVEKMHFSRILTLSSVLLSLTCLATAEYRKLELLHKSMNALRKSLQFMEDQVKNINLDGAFGCRLVGEFLTSFLEFSPVAFENIGDSVKDELRLMAMKANRIADSAIPFIKKRTPRYYADVGGLLERCESPLWYPSRVTKPELQMQPAPCSESVFNETSSDQCLRGVMGQRSDRSDSCRLSNTCLEMMTKPRQRAYVITHQVLYFQLVEMTILHAVVKSLTKMLLEVDAFRVAAFCRAQGDFTEDYREHNCLKKSQITSIPESLQDIFCSNVMRDAEEIATSGYPLTHRDLFMEQIGLCGIWGYRDFYKEEWLTHILQWQQKSGCYANKKHWICTENLAASKHRVKRAEKFLEGGCLSHKTAVALLAIAANIRFEVESISEIQ